MEIGDLVKFRDEVKGMEGLIGIIIDWNGAYPVVEWNRTCSHLNPSTEVIEFLEVIGK